MPSEAEFPFEGYKLYGPTLDRKENRHKVFLVRQWNGDRTTLTLARYRMCVHLGRILDRSEEVDHMDEDRLNDNLDNLQILTRAGNNRKSNFKRGVTFLRMKCPGCGKLFEKEKRKTHLARSKGTFTACSKKCGGSASSYVRHGNLEKLASPLCENIVGEFKVYNS